MGKRRLLLIVIILILAAAATIAYLLWNKPHKDVKEAKGIRITAAYLYNQYISDSAKARTAYTDKILEVTGEVARVALNQQDQQIVLLKTNTADAFVNCTLEENAGSPKLNSTITIKGICSGYIGGDADMGLPGDVFLIRGYFNTK
ncbi:MAG TPA: hypothetical protein PKA94_00820 [Ferruginibacter sp.]|nr:hypothetical protein [Ferruginibacter sp.]